VAVRMFHNLQFAEPLGASQESAPGAVGAEPDRGGRFTFANGVFRNPLLRRRRCTSWRRPASGIAAPTSFGEGPSWTDWFRGRCVALSSSTFAWRRVEFVLSLKEILPLLVETTRAKPPPFATVGEEVGSNGPKANMSTPIRPSFDIIIGPCKNGL
jgi:hypothetical protein